MCDQDQSKFHLHWFQATALGLLASLVAVRAQPSFSNALSLGTVDIGELKEASGIAASRNHDAVLWTHNDAGGGPRLFAIDTLGRHLGSYDLPRFTKVDYEDIAIGPGPVPGVSCLYLGDIGDNNATRQDIQVYQIPEPAVYLRHAARPLTVNLKGVRQLTLAYPDGAHNAETLLVDPLTGDLFIGTKETNVSRLYTADKAQLDAGGTIALRFVREVSFSFASGGDISPTGREIVIRQENSAFLWPRLPGQSVPDALAGTPVGIPVVGQPAEPNGEAIGFDPVGRGYFTLSDSAATQPLYYFGRRSVYAIGPPRLLVAPGATWRYLDTGTNLGVAWQQPGFIDDAWKTGDGQFGYGDNDEQTTVSFGPNGSSRFITTYFRKHFVATNTASVSRLELKLVHDDGAAAYLNGTLVALANLANGAPYNALATATQEDLEDTWFTFAVNPALLLEGTNTLAVEVHQAAANSPDLSFDAQLLAFEAARPEILTAARKPGGAFALTLTGSGSSLTIEASTNLTHWSALGSALLTNGHGAFLDSAATNALRRFYRAAQ
jgi:hypothetical protein